MSHGNIFSIFERDCSGKQPREPVAMKFRCLGFEGWNLDNFSYHVNPHVGVACVIEGLDFPEKVQSLSHTRILWWQVVRELTQW